MVVVNKGLGNGFVIGAVDSTKDQEHYFTGAKKYLEMSPLGVLTGSFDILYSTGSANIAEATGSKWILHDLAPHPTTASLLYATGQYLSGNASGVGSKWVTIRSSDRGQTWSIVDITGTINKHNAGDSIVVNSSGNIIICGVVNDTIGGSGGGGTRIIRSASTNNDTVWTNLYTSSLNSGDDGAWAVHLDGPRSKLLRHPQNQFFYYCIHTRLRGGLNTGIEIMTSSLNANSGTWGLHRIVSTGSITGSANSPDISLRDAMFSGSDLYLCGGAWSDLGTFQNSECAWILTGSAFGTGTYSNVNYKKVDTVEPIYVRSLALDQNGKIWACGYYENGGGLVVTSSTGKLFSWTTSSIVDSVLNPNNKIAPYSLFLDKFDNLWLGANTKNDGGLAPGGSILAIRPSGSDDSWNIVYNRPQSTRHAISKIVDENVYNNLLLLTITGSAAQIEEGYPYCITNLNSSSVNTSRPLELRFGLRMRDANRFVIFDDMIEALFGLSAKEASTDFPPAFSFLFSGSLLDNANSIAVRPLTGSFVEIKYRGIAISGAVDGSSSFTTGVVTGIPSIGIFRIQLSGTNFSASVSDFKFNYLESLTDGGVRFFKNIENQSLNFVNLGTNVLKKVE